jgi:hypothetical protein
VLGSELKMDGFNHEKWTNLETQLLEVGHMSRPKIFYLGLSNYVSEPMFLNVCILPFRKREVCGS